MSVRRGGGGGGGVGEERASERADRERGLEPQRISNKFTEGERKKRKSKREGSNENKGGRR